VLILAREVVVDKKEVHCRRFPRFGMAMSIEQSNRL